MNKSFLPSYVKRLGRITDAQRNNLKEFLNYKIGSIEDCNDFIKNSNAILDIGFGDGEFTVFLAEKFENYLIVASEVYQSGIGSLIGKLKAKECHSVKIFNGDVRDLIINQGKPMFDKVFAMFPDPWQKARHHKRRLINLFFFETIKPHLKRGAEIYISTDWENYAESIRELQSDLGDFIFEEGDFLETNFSTKFAKRAANEGRTIRNFKFSFLKQTN